MLDGARSSSAFFSNSDAAAGGFDQDRGRRVAVEAALFLLGALHAVVGGVDHAAPADGHATTAAISKRRHEPAPRHSGFAEEC